MRIQMMLLLALGSLSITLVCGIELDQYNDYDEMVSFLESSASSCDICETFSMGQSHERQAMKGIQIGLADDCKQTIWIDAGIHAREWIAPAVALNLINDLVEGYKNKDPDVKWLLDHYVWLISPCINPDGYMFSRAAPANRLWRKTRGKTKDPAELGTDANRNWDFHWDPPINAAVDPSSSVYRGDFAFSEVENRNVRDEILKRRKTMIVYLTLHSCGQCWLYPWGYDDTSLPDDWKQLRDVGQRAVNKIKATSGKVYTLIQSAKLYPTSGASDDWAKGVVKIKYSYTVELRDKLDKSDDFDSCTFELPAAEIKPTSKEIWEGIREMAHAIYEEEGKEEIDCCSCLELFDPGHIYMQKCGSKMTIDELKKVMKDCYKVTTVDEFRIFASNIPCPAVTDSTEQGAIRGKVKVVPCDPCCLLVPKYCKRLTNRGCSLEPGVHPHTQEIRCDVETDEGTGDGDPFTCEVKTCIEKYKGTGTGKAPPCICRKVWPCCDPEGGTTMCPKGDQCE